VRFARRRAAFRAHLGVCVVLLLTVLPCAAAAAERSRYDELKRVIDRNTGFAHMTRGMNMYTLIVLRSGVTEQDIPVLTRLLTDRDHVTQLSAANVLVDLGEEGKRGLRQALAAAPDVRTRGVIEETLRDADSPTRRPIQDYPLSEQERQRIRGCRPPASRN
jgi:HEAT repeat protein